MEAVDGVKLFVSEDADWYVLATIYEGKVEVLYEGHHLVLAYEALLHHLGLILLKQTVNMSDGSYIPKLEDMYK